jgi:hypothetical protein
MKFSEPTIANNTITDDTELKLLSLAAGSYAFDMTFWFKTSAAGDFKYGLTGPGTAGTDWQAKWSSNLADVLQFNNDIVPVLVADANFHYVRVSGFLFVSTVGDYKLRWAQNTTDAGTNTFISAGSWWRVTKAG